jgi:hypothetical protein
MKPTNIDLSPRSPRARGRAFLAVSAVALAGSALLAAGCGGSSGSGVAQVPSTKTSTSSSSSSSGSSSGDPAAYSACMRKNGVPNFPDPDSQGRFRITGGQTATGRKFGLDPDSPKFKRAQQACRRLQPNGGKPDPQQAAKDREQALEFSQCMRSHGVPKFPDPTFEANGGVSWKIPARSGFDEDSPQFQAAQKACRKLEPGAPATDEQGRP